jgi:putative membrane protein
MTDPYSRFEPDDLILRDELALDRTLLANERTLLSYLRAGVSLVLAGVSFVHFSSAQWYTTFGQVCVVGGAVATLVGVARFRRMQQMIRPLRRAAGGRSGGGHSTGGTSAESGRPQRI